MLKRGRKGETYNIGGESEWSNLDLVYELINQLAKVQSLDPSLYLNLITFVKDRPGHDLRYAIDCSKIKNELGWKPEHTFQQGIEKTIRWYLENQEWIRNVLSGNYRNWLEINYANR